MKNKEEPSSGSTRGNFWSATPQSTSADVADETLGSLSRPGRTATAPIEQPALSEDVYKRQESDDDAQHQVANTNNDKKRCHP